MTSSSPPSPRKVAAASFIGTAIEFYDYYIYGTAAALVLDAAFFPDASPLAGTLLALSSFAVGFAARPLGAILFGHFGDRIGRKTTLVVSLLLMGLSTAFIGLLPGYATLGVLAPILLFVLRVAQGIGLGGEWGGAALLSTEHAPRARRGLHAAAAQMGSPVGFFASTSVFWILSATLPEDAFASWGWRIPFLLSFVLVAIGLRIRLSIAETPEFKSYLAKASANRAPMLDALRRHPKEILLGAGAITVVYAMFYTSATYSQTYLTETVDVSQSTAQAATLIAVVVLGASTLLMAQQSDRIGRRTIVIGGSIFGMVWGLAFFPLLNTGDFVLIALGMSGALLCMGVVYGPMGAYLPELFGTDVRYSGAGFAYNLGGVLGGGAAPLLVAQLGETGHVSAIGWLLSGIALVSLLCALALPETRQRELSKV